MMNVLGMGAGIRGGGQDTLGRQGRQQEVSGWPGCYRQDARAGTAPECYQTARLDSEKHMVPLRFGAGFVFVLTGSHSISYSDLELAV